MPWNVCEPPSQQEEEAGCEIAGLSLPQGNSGQSMIPDIWPDYKETFQALGSQSSMLTCESLGGSIYSVVLAILISFFLSEISFM